MTTLSDIGEKEALRRFALPLAQRGDVVVGPGDDCAVVRSANDTVNDWLYTSDALIEGRHFTPATARIDIGHKAIGRVLSDIAAMGGEPTWCLVDLVATGEEDLETVEDIYRGIGQLADASGVSIVGGDMARGAGLQMHLFAAGHLPRGTAITRSGARADDIVYVTGELGGSIHGKHLTFEPRLAEGQWLRAGGWVTAMIDVTDGLYSDLCQVTEMSHAGADIDASRIPISPAAAQTGSDALGAALRDGEDYELLFTVVPTKRDAFESAWKAAFDLACTSIGSITEGRQGVRVMDEDGHPVSQDIEGYDHFAGNHNGQS